MRSFLLVNWLCCCYVVQGMRTILFLNDAQLDMNTGARREVGEATLVSQYTDPDPSVDLTFSYPSVIAINRSDGTVFYRMLYQHYGRSGAFCCLLANSSDGIMWKPEDTRQSLPNMPNRKYINQAFYQEGALSSVYYDPRAVSKQYQFRALIAETKQPLNESKAVIYTSSDGLHWNHQANETWQCDAYAIGEGSSFAFWNNISGKYAIVGRPMWGDRRITYHETSDWGMSSCTPTELTLETDALDTSMSEIYGMSVVPMPDAGVFVGLTWIYHTAPGSGENGYPGVIGQSPQHFNGGKIDTQVSFSRNGRTWMRTTRDPLIKNIPNTPSNGVVLPTSAVTTTNGSVLIFVSGSKQEHGNPAIDNPSDASITVYSIRKDGWVSLSADYGYAYIGTRVLYWKNQRSTLYINVDSKYGSIRAQLTDSSGVPLPGFTFAECLNATVDSTMWEPTWKTGNISTLSQTILRVEIELFNAQIYSISGDFIVMQAVEVSQWTEYKIPPRERPGFSN
eukprot:m.59456 g.59456  ORF g.59456 m.59456 type:complete len:508 (+) comp11248_c0_seq3:45-1568(+)